MKNKHREQMLADLTDAHVSLAQAYDHYTRCRRAAKRDTEIELRLIYIYQIADSLCAQMKIKV